VGVVSSLCPLFVIVMAYLMLGEKVDPLEVVGLLFVMTGVVLVIGWSQGTDRIDLHRKGLFVAFCLFMQPFMLAAGYIALRKMKQNHPMVVSCYVNLCLMVVSIVAIVFSKGVHFSFVFHVSPWTWLLFVLSSINSIFE